MVYTMFRHGHRSPYKYLDDKSKVDLIGNTWPLSSGSLTPSGKRQGYLLGAYFRHRYMIDNKFLDFKYSLGESVFMSTPVSRTIQTCETVIQGIYPPGTGPQINQEQVETAVPPQKVENIEKIKEQLGLNVLPEQVQLVYIKQVREFECPGIEAALKKQRDSTFPEYANEMIKNHGQVIKDHSKLKNDEDLLVYDNLFGFFDTLISDDFEGLKMSQELKDLGNKDDLAEKVNYEKISRIDYGDADKLVIKGRRQSELSFLNQAIKNRIEADAAKAGYSEANPKAVFFAVHDSWIISMLMLFESIGVKVPKNDVLYTSNLTIELWMNEGFEVVILFDEEIIGKMPVSEFQEGLKKIIMSEADLKAACEVKNQVYEQGMVLSSFALAMILIAVVFMILKRSLDIKFEQRKIGRVLKEGLTI